MLPGLTTEHTFNAFAIKQSKAVLGLVETSSDTCVIIVWMSQYNYRLNNRRNYISASDFQGILDNHDKTSSMLSSCSSNHKAPALSSCSWKLAGETAFIRNGMVNINSQV